MQREHELALARLDQDIEAAQLELTERTRQNTLLLEAVATHEKDRRHLEKSLNASQRKVAMTSSRMVCIAQTYLVSISGLEFHNVIGNFLFFFYRLTVP